MSTVKAHACLINTIVLVSSATYAQTPCPSAHATNGSPIRPRLGHSVNISRWLHQHRRTVSCYTGGARAQPPNRVFPFNPEYGLPRRAGGGAQAQEMRCARRSRFPIRQSSLSFSAAARQIAAGKPRLVFNRGRVRAQHGRRRRQLPACGRGQSVLVAAEGSMCPPPQDHQGSLSIDAGVAAMCLSRIQRVVTATGSQAGWSTVDLAAAGCRPRSKRHNPKQVVAPALVQDHPTTTHQFALAQLVRRIGRG